MVPKVAFSGFAARYRKPTVEEGFEDVCVVDFVVSGAPAPPEDTPCINKQRVGDAVTYCVRMAEC